jgi:CHAT domain-containing protein
VALAALAANDELRSAFSARKGARLLLLGTPLSGSVAMARVLLGHDRLIRYLAMLDLDRPEQDIAGMFREFPGLVGLLPEATLDDLFTAGTWSSVLPDGRPLPDAKVLQEARAARDKLATLKLDSVPLAYVGAAEGLALSMQIAGSGVRFFARQGGDAALAADRSLLPNSAVSWAPTQAGALAGYRPAFDAYADLLVMGSTRRLPMPSSGRSNAPVEAVELFPDVAPVFPDERELAAAALGYVRKAFRAEQPKTELKVVHGHLAAARWPVAVGHYEGDTLNGGEEALDRALDRRLTRRRNLRVYPGPIGTAEVILDPARSPLGALVVGIGRVGELTPGALRRTLTRALRRYALAVREQRVLPEDQMALSMIMIGTGEGGVGTRDALTAILQAFIQANKRLEDNAFKTVEFFELFEDRAIQAAHELAAALRSEEFSESFDFDGLVQSRTGGHRQSAGYEDPGWWRRLQVRARKDGELRFTDLTDRARVPVSLVASERKQVDEFVRGAVIQTHATDEFPASATLYELLLPPRLKEESHNDRNVVLVLDQRAASYPWELLRRPGRDDKPMSIRAGMIRQLTEMQLPERPIISIGNEALVVGDPPSGLPEFGPLPGARAEAELVVQRLRADFDVTDRIHRADGSSSLPAILCGRWRLMHLAGHGAFRFKKDGGRLTGMALEGGGFFTPQNVAQMEAIPEFVFLNCCYLGATDPTAEKKIQRRYHELAANMATAFIKLGAHAVIAAGWAVDDSAARYFADVFYHRMLEGETFGVATTAARRDVYNRYGVNNNTWGAYQCYGDSAYRLLPERRAARVPQSERPYVHVREPIVEVSNLAQQAKVLALADPAQLRERLETVVASIQVHRWSEDAELQAAFGNAYGDLGMIDKAIEAYTLAVRSEKAWAPIRAIEQLANLLVRRAARQAQPDARKVIREAIATLKHLPKLADGRPTSERLSLLGSCCKRLAFVTAGKERMDALKEMSRWYKLAYERKQENAEPDRYYPLLNWLLAENLRALLDGKLQVPKDMDALLTQAEADAAAAYVDDPQFWHAVAVADVVLGRALLTGDLHLSARQAGVVEAYLKPWRRGASALQFASVLEQIDFVAAVLKDDTGAQPALGRKQMCEALQAIALQLRAATQVT